jgi:hypothetical protein
MDLISNRLLVPAINNFVLLRLKPRWSKVAGREQQAN